MSTQIPAPMPIFLVTIRFDDGDSDDYGRPVASTKEIEQCAPNAGEAEKIALAHFVEEVDGDILGVETEPTFDLVQGNGNASCST